MESMSSLKKQLAQKNKEIDDLRQSPHLDPVVVKAEKAYKDALSKARENTRLKLRPLLEEEKAIEKKIDALQKQKEEEILHDTQNFLDRLSHGVDWGSKGLVIKWVSPSIKTWKEYATKEESK